MTGRGYSGHGGCCCFFVLALAVFAGIRGRGDAQARTSAGYFFFISFILLVILSRFVVFFFVSRSDSLYLCYRSLRFCCDSEFIVLTTNYVLHEVILFHEIIE